MSKNVLLLKILFILLLTFFPFAEILRFTLGNDIFIKPLDVLSVTFFIWTAILYIKNEQWRRNLKWYYFFFPLIGFISLIINSYWLNVHNLFASFLYGLRWISYLSIFFAVQQFDESFKKKVIRFLVIDGIVILLIGYIQFFFYPSLRNLYYLGWDEHLYRMFSSFLDPNFAGTFFVLYFIFIAGLLANKTKKLTKKTFYFYIGLLIVTLVAVFLTYSRSALLMLLASGITLFVLLNKKKFILYLIGAIAIFIILISPFFYIENIDLLRINSSIARLQTAGSAVTVIQKNPLIGVGFDSYRYAQIRYNLIKPTSQFQSHSAAGDDVSLLFVFATTGIVGLIAYCYLWFRLFKNAKYMIKKNMFAVVFVASGIGLFINSLFINSLFYSEVMFWIWIIVGLMQEKFVY